MKSSSSSDLLKFMLIPTKFRLSPFPSAGLKCVDSAIKKGFSDAETLERKTRLKLATLSLEG